jgi:uracil phosphoribosyltransferase
MNSNVTVFDHPLITHKISLLRDVQTGSKQFRELIEEIAMLMAYEALRDLPTKEIEIQTPITKTTTRVISGKKLAIVPILRAGLGMVQGLLALVPSAKVGHIGLYRDHETLEPHEYYCKLPDDIGNRLVIILDPMLATGGSGVAGVNFLKQRGCTNIKFMSIIAAPEGIEKLTAAHPDIQLYCGCVDEKLNENGYIVPGLGDAGDRIFGTK